MRVIGVGIIMVGLLSGCDNGTIAQMSQKVKTKVTALSVNKSANSTEEKQLRDTVFFSFDRSGIQESDLVALDALAQRLSEQMNMRIQISGYTDERGSSEYNIALGWRRALSVSNYMQTQGVAKDRIDLVSYGKEKPLDMHHNEAAWSKNRRVELRTMS